MSKNVAVAKPGNFRFQDWRGTLRRAVELTWAQQKGLAQAERPRDIRTWIEGQLYQPQY